MSKTDASAVRVPGHGLVREILDFLEERRFEPGDRLPSERLLADKLGVGRNAVREAFAVLSSMRVVEIRPNSGVYLRRIAAESSFEQIVLFAALGELPTPAQVTESMEVRTALETLALKLACTRRTAADIAALRRILAEEKAAVRRGENTGDADNAFHLGLVGCAHNSILLRLLNSFYQLSLARRKVFFANRSRARESSIDHARITDAIEARDTAAATRLFLKHMQRARLYWASVLDEKAPARNKRRR